MEQIKYLLVITLVYINSFCSMEAQNNTILVSRIKAIPDLVALWDFKESKGKNRKSFGKNVFPLTEAGGVIHRANEGPLSGYSARFDGSNYLTLLNKYTGDLNIYGEDKEVTILAWVKWDGDQIGFVGGMWNEYKGGGQRQYGLFVSLPYYNGENQVCGHISNTGKPTPPFPYSIDYSASEQKIEKKEWQFIAFTYDGQYIRSYLNGEFKKREPEVINHTISFEGYPKGLIQTKNPYYFPDGIGNNGSDFTVGAVLVKSGMGNFFKGLIGGLAIYNRALSDSELSDLAKKSNFIIKK